MRFLLRFGVPLTVALAIVTVSLTPLADSLLGRWFQRDLQLRSALIFNAIGPSVEGLIATGNTASLAQLFEAITKDERVMAMGLCSSAGVLLVKSAAWPSHLNCPLLEEEKRAASFEREKTLLS